MEQLNIESFSRLVAMERPYAIASLQGNDNFPEISGVVRFYIADQGTLVLAEVFNLPHELRPRTDRRFGPFYAFHLHEGGSCGSGAGASPFEASGNHYNPDNQLHPYHAGDFPPLLSNGGYAYGSFYTGRFKPQDAVGKTVVIHQHTDDFMTQPSGDSGVKLACGTVMMGVQPLG